MADARPDSNEVDLTGAFGPAGKWPKVISLVRTGRFDAPARDADEAGEMDEVESKTGPYAIAKNARRGR